MESAGLRPHPLPPKPTTYEIWREDRPQYLSAYNLAFNAEKFATKQAEANPINRKDNIISARVAGYLLVELFNRRAILTEGPCRYLSKELRSEDREDGDSNDVVFKVGKFHCDYFLCSFRTITEYPTEYPISSSDPSGISFDTVEDMTFDYIIADGKDYRTAWRKVLARDGYRCLLTGKFDMESANINRELDEKRTCLGAGTAVVPACHILSESAMQGVDPTGSSEDSSVMNKTNHPTAAMSLLSSFGLENLVENLAENGVHSLRNLLSLDHSYFNYLELWFEYTEEPNCYQVCVAEPFDEVHLRQSGHLDSDHLNRLFVTFSRTHESQELPDPQLLALHAACARVAYMSGAADVWDEVESDAAATIFALTLFS